MKSTFWLDTDSALYYDPNTINNDYDLVYYSFAKLNSELSSVIVGDNFDDFLSIPQKKILTFGGWDFSTNADTYQIFRNAIKAGNREKVGKVISDFVKANGLDGVNFDWEYPGAPDIPGIPAGSKDDGPNYSGLVQTVKNDLGNQFLVSVSLPASYWYLKNFPLSTMNTYVDYFVFMNYDYTGQWDYGKANTGIGCHNDQSLTMEALKMLTKAGIPASKIHGGLANYGRAYELSNANCIGYKCGFTSNPPSGPYTNSPGFLSINEIENLSFSETEFNATSKCFFGIFDNNDWVAWMHESDLNYLEGDYINMGLGGSALWLINYNSNEEDNEDCEFLFNSDGTDFDLICYTEDLSNIRSQNSKEIKKPNAKVADSLSLIGAMDETYTHARRALTYLTAQNAANLIMLGGPLIQNYYKHISKIISKLLPGITYSNKNRQDYIDIMKILSTEALDVSDGLEGKLYNDQIIYPKGISDEDRSFIIDIYEHQGITDIFNEALTEPYKVNDDDFEITFESLTYYRKDPIPRTPTPYFSPFNDGVLTICKGDSRCESFVRSKFINQDNIENLLALAYYWQTGNSFSTDFKNGNLKRSISLPPVYIINIDGQSPGVACNSMLFLSGYFNDYSKKIDQLTKAKPGDNVAKRKASTGPFLPCVIMGTNNFAKFKGKKYQLDEFPFASSKEMIIGNKNYVSVSCVDAADNYIDGANLGRFYAGRGPGTSFSDITRKTSQNDWTAWYPNCLKVPYLANNGLCFDRCEMKANDKFKIYILVPLSCYVHRDHYCIYLLCF